MFERFRSPCNVDAHMCGSRGRGKLYVGLGVHYSSIDLRTYLAAMLASWTPRRARTLAGVGGSAISPPQPKPSSAVGTPLARFHAHLRPRHRALHPPCEAVAG